MADTATYVFCVIHSPAEPSVKGAPRAADGTGPVRLIRLGGDLWAAAADAPLDRFSAERLEQELRDLEAISRHALGHASVVEFFFRQAAVVPLRLFALFHDDESARRHLHGRRTSLARVLSRVKGMEEWGVRLIAPPAERRAGRSKPASGRAYLQAKRLPAREGSPPRAVSRSFAGVMRTLRARAVAARRQKFPPRASGRRYVVGGSFLVKTGHRAGWVRELEKQRARLAATGSALEASGPWPPYHFVAAPARRRRAARTARSR